MDNKAIAILHGLSSKQRESLKRKLLQKGGDWRSLPVLRRPHDLASLPVSYGQSRLWILHELDLDRSAYNVPLAMRVRGLHAGTFERALNHVVARHEVLRTRYEIAGEQLVQVIDPQGEIPVALSDLTGMSEPEREREVMRLAQEEAQKPFDLATGPVLRAVLLKLAPQEHVLLLTLHHIACDAWSVNVLRQEVAAHYAALLRDESPSVPELSVQYADFAHWQRQWLSGDALEAQLSYWRAQLNGAPDLLALPTDRPRPAIRTHRGALFKQAIPVETVVRLQALSLRTETTLFMVLTAAFNVLLWRYTGQADICVGTVLANRSRCELESLIGFFVNTVAVRTRLNERDSFRELLQQVKATTLAAQEHQDVPFEQVIDALELPRSASHTPLFQTMLVLQNTPQGSVQAAGDLEYELFDSGSPAARFDLTLNLTRADDRLWQQFEYSEDLFDQTTIARMSSHFERLLEQVAAEPEIALARLQLLDEQERHQLLHAWNATEAAYPSDRCVHELFEQQAMRTPQATALVCEEHSLSYAELNEQANRLAHHLIALGVRPDTRVAIALSRSVQMVVALLATLKAGGAYVPLDPDYPAERLGFMLADSRPAVLLCDAAGAARLPAPGMPMCRLDQDEPPWAALPADDLPVHALGLSPRHLAYVIYTSGSTGSPKGAMNEHGAVVNRLWWMQQAYGLDAADAVLQKTPFGFDVSVWEFFWTWLAGARLVLARPQGQRDANYLASLIERKQITTLHFVPSMLSAFLAALPAGGCASLRRIVCSGEALNEREVRAVHERLPQARLYNLYGPTEAAVDVTACEPQPGAPVTIGRPIANTRIYILDAHGQPVPVGIAGEIHIGGAGVARGYLHRPDLTAERFVSDPFAGRPDARMYKTGDLGRWLIDNKGDGTIEYLGRNDHQVKIRGFRIEPGEIEAQLLTLPGVSEAVVLAREDEPGHKRLVAYLTGEPSLEPEALRDQLAASLPEYMVPAAYVQLDALPLTPNGKLDRRALPAPEGDAFGTRVYEAPQGDVETALAEIWSELLGIERIGRHDHFFELGGHSLLAVRLIVRMRSQGWQVEVRSLFTSPTLAALAATVSALAAVPVPPNLIAEGCDRITPELLPLVQLSQGAIDAVVATVPGGVANVQDIYPLAPLQEGILFHHLAASFGDAYLQPHVLAFDSRERLDAFLAALQSVIDRHDILRTAFMWQGLPEPVQVVWRRAPLPVEELVLDGPDVAEQLLAHFNPSHTRIDVRQAPLLRAHVAHDAGHERWLLCLLLHHLLGDHTTLELAVEEVQAHLAGQAQQLPPPLPFRDFIAQARFGLAREQHEAFFRQMLGDVDEPTAPFGLLDVHGDGSGVHEARLPLEPGLARELSEQARRLGVSRASLFHLAWSLVLARTSARNDVVFGTVLFGRLQGGEGAHRVLGMFLNTLPFRVRLDATGVEAAVRGTHERLAQLLHHEHAPLALAQRASGVPVSAPLFTSLLNYRHDGGSAVLAHDPASQEHAWDGMQMLHAQERTNYPLVLSVNDAGEDYSLDVQVDQRVDAQRVGGYMLQALQALAHALQHAPSAAVCSLDVLLPAERHQVVHGWNATDASCPAERCIHQLFEVQAARTPEAIAVVSEDTTLSYAELNAQANRLADHLISLGVGPDTLVALCVERSVPMVVALLATLKAGGAYVPLDPDYPAERLAFMLADSAPRVLITQAALRADLEVLPPSMAVLEIDAPVRPWDALPDTNLEPAALGLHPSHLAYVIYTSGSTGTPKAAQVAHRGLRNLLDWYVHDLGFDAEDSVLLATSPSFDLTQKNILGPLIVGATLHLGGELFEPSRLLEQISTHSIRCLNVAPSAFHALIDAAGEKPMSSLRRVMLGGEPIQVHKLLQLHEPRPQIVNNYGPTECSDVVAYHVLQEPLQRYAPAGVPLGKPVRNTQLYVLDAYGQPAPVGVIGEICVAGAGVGWGYLHRPELTAQRFVPDPFAPDPGERMYRTGDMGRWKFDGTVEFVGRNDHQVKVRGFRIELGEIEARLREHPNVREAVVLACEDATGDKRLVAYVIAGEALAPEALHEHLGALLPEYMVPAAYVRLDAWPLTPNGKLDRRALPAPEGAAFGTQAYEAPQDELESTLAAIWSELLGIERIGRHDSFFALGGHSLLAVQLSSRLRTRLGLEVPLAELFAQPTLAGYAARMAAASASTLPAIVPASRDEPLPLSFAQQRLWFLARLDARTRATYLIPAGVRLLGTLDVPALHAALQRVVARHEALRTRFVAIDGTPVQVIEPSGTDLALQEVDLSGQPEAALERLAAEEAGAPFDLEQGPLIRARLVRLGQHDHVLLVTMHHIVFDGWSMGVLIQEVSTLYTAFLQGQPDPLPALPMQYADYAVWQRRWISGAVLQHQLDFWRTHLSGAPALLELATDRPRPPVQDFAGAAFSFELDADLSAALKGLSRRHGTTLFMTLLASWAALLSRLSGQNDVVIGTPVANRTRSELEPLIGFFVNTLALRVDVSGEPSVAALLAQVRSTTLAAQAHQDVPFEQVVETLRPVRSLAHSPVFQVMFVWQNAPEGTLELPGLQLQPVGAASSTVKFDLDMSMQEAGEVIVGSIQYASALFDGSTIERHIAHWQTLLRAMVADATQPVHGLVLLSAEQRHQLVYGWNATDTAFPAERCIHALFEEQVQRTPEATALVFEDTTLSYAELNARANRLAHRLIALGVRPDTRVAIALQRSLEMVVALLASLKAGGAYVPLDPDYPAERLAFMLEDSAPLVLLTDAGVRIGLGALPAPLTVLDLDSPSRDWDSLPAINPDASVLGLTSSHLAYVIYTSGSTGLPKGVMVEHRSVVHSTMCRQWTYGNPGRFLLLSPLSFDSSVAGIFGTLVSGGALVVVSAEISRNADLLQQHIRAQHIQSLLCVPSLYQHLVRNLADATHLSTVIVAGEACPPALLQTSAHTAPHVELFNEYGPTECTVWAAVHRCEPQPGGTTVPIGRPIANTRIYILDAHGVLVPVGVAGEIHIGGAGVARGYLGRPDLSAERFVPDPFAAEFGARMYKTGDLGRWRAEGTIEYLGRNDQQVKIRGFRIELGEIEAALLQHPEVRAAVVLAREDVPGDKRLVAYVVGESGLERESLRAHLAASQPDYMVPTAYVRLDALPLTPNGKLDRRALPAPGDGAFGNRAYEAPEGELEATLAAIWRELLGLERVGCHDHFFELGGHSLLAVQLISRIRVRLGCEVPLAELFAQPTLAGFALRVAAATASTLPAIVPASRGEPLPLSFAQQRLWFLTRLDERAGAAYLIPGGVRLLGALDVAALRAALDRIVARHDALRTRFVMQGGAAVQVIAEPGVGFELTWVNLTGHAEPETELERLAGEDASTPFDLERGPLIRGRLVRLAEQDHVLLVTMHHIVSDGWSMGVLINEASALYAAFSQGQPDPLPALAIQYADYAAWQRRWISGDVLQRQLDFWRTHLSGAPALLEQPTDRPRRAVQDHAGAQLSFELDEELSAGLKALSRRHGATLFMTLLAAWAALLARLSGQDEVVIGTPVANRHRAEVEPLIGFFVNTQALRIDLSGSPSVAQLLAQVRITALAAQGHQDIPFEQVVEALNPPRSLAHSPVFQVMFAWQNAPEGRLELPGLQLQPLRAALDTVKFDLDLSLQEDGERIAGSLRYASALFDETSIERQLALWQTLLRAMVADDTALVPRLPLLGDAERQQLLHGWNATEVAFTKLCLHELFEAQAARTPEAVAAVFEDISLNYAELNARANRLAHHLRRLGVVPDTRVAICVERGVPMVVGLLAILKAGGAYVPLDPDYPPERLAFMLADSRPAALLSDAAGAARLPAHGTPVCRLDQDEPPWAGLPADNLPAHELGLSPRHLAYVIYTSGSTGSPKGAMNEHGAVVNRLWWMQHAYGLGAADAVLQKTPFGFDVSVWEFFWTWLAGARLVLARPQGQRDAHYLAALIEREQVTTLHFVPSMLSAFLLALPQGGCASLRRIVCSGEALGEREVRAVHERLSQARLVNLYGPTEAAVDVTACEPLPGAPVTIGSPIANTRMYILDAHGEPVPVGVAGELHIGGVQVGRGYLDRPQLTAERFVPDPFAALPGARMYRTGDMGRWLIEHNGDGTIEFLGRNDEQVKIRGFRIEPGEIEARLLQHPEVRAAAVLAREDAPGDKRLVAYVVGENALEPEAIRAHLAASLPEYMVPAGYVRLDALPLTANGKLDRRALPAPDGDAFGTRAYEAPHGELETTLASLWSDLLGLERIGRHDDFFVLGGHSLLAVQLTFKVQQVLQRTLQLREIFTHPTLRELAAYLDALAPQALLPLITPVPREGALPLAPVQERLWVVHQMQGRQSSYNMPMALHLKGPVSVPALQSAFASLVQRHEVLRTRFLADAQGRPGQVVETASELHIPVRQASHAEVPALVAAHAAHVFDLGRAPLLNVQVLRLAEQEHVLLLNVHHIVSDGWSMNVLAHDMQRLYVAQLLGQPAQLPELKVQYGDYAHWQHQQDMAMHAAYWEQELQGHEPGLSLPMDRPAQLQPWTARTLTLDYPEDLCATLAGFCAQHGATLFMALTAALAAVLQRYTGRRDMCLGTTVAGRDRAELEPLIGFFINIVALRLDLSGDPSGSELIERVKRTVLRALEHQALPFEQVLQQHKLSGDSGQALVPVMVRHQNFPDTVDTQWGDGLTVELLPGSEQSAKCPLDVQFFGDTRGLSATVEYAADLFDEATVLRLLQHHQQVLQQMVRQPMQPLSSLQLLTADEQHLIEQTNRTTRELDDAPGVVALFERQVQVSPGACACIDEQGRLSYAELNARANRIAHALRARGAGPEVRVGLYMPRSCEFIAAMLGIFKAGGVYVPLDVNAPTAYLQRLIDDAQPQVVLHGPQPPAAACPDVELLSVGEAASQGPETNLSEPWHPQQLAMLAYTSGSTGWPKGVLVPHGQLLNLLRSMQVKLPLGPGDIVAQKTMAPFVVSMKELWDALLAGVPQVVVEDALLRDPPKLIAALQRGSVSRLFIVPSHLQAVLDALDDPQALSCLKVCVTAGEPLSRQLAERVQRTLPWVAVWNNFGCTELNDTTYCDPAHLGGAGQFVSIGRPIDNMQVHVLDERLREQPIGVVGELGVHYPWMARGYWRQPELTAERFVPNPYGPPGSRLYRTGDLVRRLPDGALEYLGREDFDIKIRGQRVDVRQVEAALANCEDVHLSAAGAWLDDRGDTHLVAYVVPRSEQPVHAAQLRRELATRLPAFMVPSLYVALQALPRTSTGKLDRKALPAPELNALAREPYVAPRTDTERILAGIWSDVLGVPLERLGVHDNFFAMGGHSLGAVRVVDLARQHSLDVPLAAMFAQPHLRALAESLATPAQAQAPAPAQPRAVCLRKGSGRHRPLFCVPPASGVPSGYAVLASRLDVPIPVYGLMGQHKTSAPWRTFAEAAASLVRQMREVQPRGPYRLAGWSLAGSLAYEMATQLIEEGESVEYLALFDSFRNMTLLPAYGLGSQVERLDQLDIGALPNISPVDIAEQVSQWREHILAAEAALHDFVPRPTRIPIHLFTAEGNMNRAGWPYLGWDSVVPADRITAIPVAGSHDDMLSEPFVRSLAREVSLTLHRCMSEEGHEDQAMPVQQSR